MTVKQLMLSKIYPVYQFVAHLLKLKMRIKAGNVAPTVSFYNLRAEKYDGTIISFSQFKGKKVLIVNVASDCIYTSQYKSLNAFYQLHHNEFEILAFPCNEFGKQEQKKNEEIAKFCAVNFGLKFPLMKKTYVKKGALQHVVYHWLTNESLNGWNNQQPAWNFSKYLVDENGNLKYYFDPGVNVELLVEKPG